MKKIAAFTLAEVLITLTIIGVVAAITIPGMVVKYQKDQTVAQLKKAYTTLAQAIRLSEAENGPNKDWDWGINGDESSISNSFNTYWKPYLKVLKVCSTYSDCGYKISKPWVFINGTESTLTSVRVDIRTAMILQDGTYVMIQNYGGDPVVLAKYIYVDINGSKTPNQYGKDFFMFFLEDKKGLVPYGYKNDASLYCSITASGDSCAAKIIKDGWQIADDYPW